MPPPDDVSPIRRECLLPYPLDQGLLAGAAAGTRSLYGPDVQRTAGWLASLASPVQLRKAIQAAWMGTSLPLRDWSRNISDAGAIFDPEAGHFGAYIRLTRPRAAFVQHAPTPPHECQARLSALIDDPPREVIEMFSAAPGLTAGRGPTVALSEFLLHPMDTPACFHSVEKCIFSDCMVWTREQGACELMWFNSCDGPEQHYILLGHDSAPYLYAEGETEEPQELDLTAADVLALYFRSPARMLAEALGRLKPSGRRIPWTVPGEHARAAFARCAGPVQYALALRAVRRMMAGHENSPAWSRIERVVEAMTDSVLQASPLDPALREECSALFEDRDQLDHAMFDAVHLRIYVGQLASGWNGAAAAPYPYVSIRRDGEVFGEPIYWGVLRDIAKIKERGGAAETQDTAQWLLSIPL